MKAGVVGHKSGTRSRGGYSEDEFHMDILDFISSLEVPGSPLLQGEELLPWTVLSPSELRKELVGKFFCPEPTGVMEWSKDQQPEDERVGDADAGTCPEEMLLQGRRHIFFPLEQEVGVGTEAEQLERRVGGDKSCAEEEVRMGVCSLEASCENRQRKSSSSTRVSNGACGMQQKRDTYPLFSMVDRPTLISSIPFLDRRQAGVLPSSRTLEDVHNTRGTSLKELLDVVPHPTQVITLKQALSQPEGGIKKAARDKSSRKPPSRNALTVGSMCYCHVSKAPCAKEAPRPDKFPPAASVRSNTSSHKRIRHRHNMSSCKPRQGSWSGRWNGWAGEDSGAHSGRHSSNSIWHSGSESTRGFVVSTKRCESTDKEQVPRLRSKPVRGSLSFGASHASNSRGSGCKVCGEEKAGGNPTCVACKLLLQFDKQLDSMLLQLSQSFQSNELLLSTDPSSHASSTSVVIHNVLSSSSRHSFPNDTLQKFLHLHSGSGSESAAEQQPSRSLNPSPHRDLDLRSVYYTSAPFFQGKVGVARTAVHNFCACMVSCQELGGVVKDERQRGVQAAWVNQMVYLRFEEESYGLDTGEHGFPSPRFRRQVFLDKFHRLSCAFPEQGGITTMPHKHVHSGQLGDFYQFCRSKLRLIQDRIGWQTHSWPPLLLHHFFQAMKHLWRLHKLAFSLEPAATLVCVHRGADFDHKYMELVEMDSTVQSGVRRYFPPHIKVLQHESGRRNGAVPCPVVDFMLTPGFQLGEKVIRSQVCLQQTAARPAPSNWSS